MCFLWLINVCSTEAAAFTGAMNMMLAKAAPWPITNTCALAYASSCCRKVNTSMYTSLYNRQKLVMPDQVSVLLNPDVALKRQPDCQSMLTTNSAAEHSTAQHSRAQQSRAQHSTAQHSAAVKVSPRQLCEATTTRCDSAMQVGSAKALLDSGDLLHGLH